MEEWTMKDAMELYETGLRLVRVTMFGDIYPIFEKQMELETAQVLSAQIVNYLMGDEPSGDKLKPALRCKFDMIRGQICQKATDVMQSDRLMREVVVNMLRMRSIMEFAIQGPSYMSSREHQRIENILKEFGPEFPREVVPAEFAALLFTYHGIRFKKS